jgi:glyoxalase family protein
MNMPLSYHSVGNDAAGDAPMTLHPYTLVHDRMEGGGKSGCRWSIALQQLCSAHSLNKTKKEGRGITMSKIQVQGIHHITFVGSNREAIIDFYEGILGMPLVIDQPNLDVPGETHLYFDAGDGRLVTFFVRPTRENDPTPNPEGIGNLHHLALTVSRSTYTQVAQRLNERGIWNTGNIDRGFMDSIYFRDPNGQLLELACYKFVPPEGYTYGDVLVTAQRIRMAAGAPFIHDEHLADAIAELIGRKAISLTGTELPKAEEAKSAPTKEKEGEVELEIS